MEHYGVHLEKIDIMPFQNRVQSMCANQKAFLQYRKNRMALIEDHEGRKFKGDAAHIPFHITMIENEKRIAAEERERLQEEAPALTKADSFDSDDLIHQPFYSPIQVTGPDTETEIYDPLDVDVKIMG